MRFEARQWVPFPVEQVFAFFADPRNMPRLMPPELGTRIEELRLMPAPAQSSGSDKANLSGGEVAGEGSEMRISFRPVPFLPLRVRWLARITEFEWNSHFKDEQVRGPFAVFRHRHGTLDATRNGQAGTLVTDEIDYALPFGTLGRLVSPLVRRQLQRSFAQRQERLPLMLAAAARKERQS
jgi:ligand-binding SRPBCC domain-containing protein